MILGNNHESDTYPESILWTRAYAKNSNYCDTLVYPLTIVGHCPTSMSNHNFDSFSNITTILDKRNNMELNTKCDTNLEGHRGCVALGCENEDNRPTLAFVDIAMSHAFFNETEINENRIVEILRLHHDSSKDSSKYYYNQISLVIIDKNFSKEEIVWPKINSEIVPDNSLNDSSSISKMDVQTNSIPVKAPDEAPVKAPVILSDIFTNFSKENLNIIKNIDSNQVKLYNEKLLNPELKLTNIEILKYIQQLKIIYNNSNNKLNILKLLLATKTKYNQ